MYWMHCCRPSSISPNCYPKTALARASASISSFGTVLVVLRLGLPEPLSFLPKIVPAAFNNVTYSWVIVTVFNPSVSLVLTLISWLLCDQNIFCSWLGTVSKTKHNCSSNDSFRYQELKTSKWSASSSFVAWLFLEPS